MAGGIGLMARPRPPPSTTRPPAFSPRPAPCPPPGPSRASACWAMVMSWWRRDDDANTTPRASSTTPRPDVHGSAIPEPRAAAAELADGNVLLAGGTGRRALSSAVMYDPTPARGPPPGNWPPARGSPGRCVWPGDSAGGRRRRQTATSTTRQPMHGRSPPASTGDTSLPEVTDWRRQRAGRRRPGTRQGGHSGALYHLDNHGTAPGRCPDPRAAGFTDRAQQRPGGRGGRWRHSDRGGRSTSADLRRSAAPPPTKPATKPGADTAGRPTQADPAPAGSTPPTPTAATTGTSTGTPGPAPLGRHRAPVGGVHIDIADRHIDSAPPRTTPPRPPANRPRQRPP